LAAVDRVVLRQLLEFREQMEAHLHSIHHLHLAAVAVGIRQVVQVDLAVVADLARTQAEQEIQVHIHQLKVTLVERDMVLEVITTARVAVVQVRLVETLQPARVEMAEMVWQVL
jgi:hypothetical protein